MASKQQPLDFEAAIKAELDRINGELAAYDAMVAERDRLQRALKAYTNGTEPAPAKPAAKRSRQRATQAAPEDRAAAIMEVVNAHPEGVTKTDVAEAIGVSINTAAKVIGAMLDTGQIKDNGQQKRAYRLLPVGKA